MGQWKGTVVCRIKGFCHINTERCLEIHDIKKCGNCPNFIKILEIQETLKFDEFQRANERRKLASKKKGSR